MSGDGHLNIESSVDGGTATVKLIGELDLDGTDKATEALVGHAGTDVKNVVVDASGLTSLASSGLRAPPQPREQLNEADVPPSLEKATAPVSRAPEMPGTPELL